MIFISRLKLRNFKSFKYVDVQLPKTFLCLAGPNGSGKSNLTDAIRFALGEISLKSLRAKKVRDLIFHGASTAEVNLILDGDAKYDIKRAIRMDGKILYRLNGKKATRWAILDALKKHNLDDSGRNTIAQGEVQRIINMGGKERRTIIDSVAGIADFEEKKKEALGELGVVENRIKDANLILGERTAFLNELGREREAAIQFLDSKRKLTNAKATLLKNEKARYEKELKEIAESEGKVKFKLDERDAELKTLETKILETEKMRSESSHELQLRQQTASLIKKVEELKASINSKNQIILDKEISLKKLDDEVATTFILEKENSTIRSINTEIDQLKKELQEKEHELSKEVNIGDANYLSELRKNIEELKKEHAKLRERVILLDSEINTKNEIAEIKTREITSIKTKDEDETTDSIKTGINDLIKESKEISKKIEDSFKQIRETNTALVDADKKLIDLREKSSLLKFKSSPTITNSALSFVNLLKQKGERGIYGCVVDLIKFDSKYGLAIEVAGGSRLYYVVVDSAEVATRIIEKLKAASTGRVTFIPLKEIKVSSQQPPRGCSFLSSFVDHPSEIKKAVDFILGDTVLLSSTKEANEIGIGNYRMVTTTGEVFERSGLVSGGKTESNLAIAAEARKIDAALNETKARKEELSKQVIAIREEEAELRAQKTEIDIKIKTLEMKIKFEDERKAEYLETEKRKEQLKQDLETIRSHIKTTSQERDKSVETSMLVEKKIVTLLAMLTEREGEAKVVNEEAQKKRTSQISRISTLRATIEGKTKELELRKEELFKKQARLKEIEKERKYLMEKINELKRHILNESEELRVNEQKIMKHSSEIEKLFELMKEYELKLQEIGQQRGEKKLEVDKLNKELSQFEIKKATAETRLSDITVEFSSYQGFDYLDLKKDELNQMIKDAEQILSSLGNVNLAAVEMYEKKKAEISEMETRVSKLAAEREAILTMVSELEEKKKAAFFEAFNSIHDNFKRMFKYIDIGEGYLYLDNPNSPFESCLYIRIKRNNKDHSLDSLSGGESSLVALMFIFALQFFKPSPFYILDEVDAALDKENSKRLAQIIVEMSKDSQFFVVSHNDIIMSEAAAVLGVTRVNSSSKLVGVKLEQITDA